MSYPAKIANLSTYKTRQIALPNRVGCLFVYVRVFGDTLQDMDGSPLLFTITLFFSLLAAREFTRKKNAIMKKMYVTLLFIFGINVFSFSQKLLLEPQTSISEVKTYLGYGKFSDSISVCTMYLYDTEIVRKYDIYVIADLNNYLPDSENIADWNNTEINDEEELLLKKQGVILCDTNINGVKISGWYKVYHYSEKQKRNQGGKNIDSGISKNKNKNKYKPIRSKQDLIKALDNLKYK